MKQTNEAYRPHRGLEKTIEAQSHNSGSMYYATDTHRMFFDTSDKRLGVRGEGVAFVYGSAPAEEVKEKEGSIDIYEFPRKRIDGHYNREDIIINQDNVFYKIINIESSDTHVECERLLMAGSGGSGQDLILRLVNSFPTVIPKGHSAKAQFVAKSNSGDEFLVIYLRMRREASDALPTYEKYWQINVGEPFEVEVPADWFQAGASNLVQLQLSSYDGRQSSVLSFPVTCLDISFKLTEKWNPREIFGGVNNKQLNVPWKIDIAGGVSSDIIANLAVDVEWTMDGTKLPKETYTSLNGQKNFSDQTSASTFKHGAHKFTAYATTTINNTQVVLGDIYQEIAWVEVDNYTPIIWSPMKEEINIEKYTLLNIPYMVYKTQAASMTVLLSSNGELIDDGREQSYSSLEWIEWEVTDYSEGLNILRINCGEATPKVFYVNITKNEDMLDAEPIEEGCILHLSSKGKANDTSLVTRMTWKNTATDDGAGLIDLENKPIKFTGFNWYNNGWIKDSEGNTVLRLSNGAKVEIPMTTIEFATAQPRTYEIDFKVRNAVNFSKLIDIQPKLDENNNPMYEQDPTNPDNMIPLMEKTVKSTEGVFLRYFSDSDKKGFCLGTQEAFYSFSEHDLVNVRYADNERIKVSFVVNPAENDKKVYVYLNGIITGIIPLIVNDFAAEDASVLTINSDYCDVDIYNIRVYKTALNFDDIVQNWVGDSSLLATMVEKYNQNNFTTTDALGNITIDYNAVKQAQLIPTMVIKTYDGKADQVSGADDMLPYLKGSKKVVGVRYFNPFDLSKGFKAQNVELDVQGTSSQGYPRRNYKLKLKKKADWAKLPFKFETWDGNDNNANIWDSENSTALKKYDLGYGLGETTFCLKADYMESSGTHNTGLANYVQFLINSNTAKTFDLSHPLQRLAGQNYARTTVYGFPILLFHEDAAGNISFIGKYNFNIDKGATDSFGFTYGEEQPFSQPIYPQYEEVDDVMVETSANKQVNKGTYEQVAECWEFKQNQAGLGKFTEGAFDQLIGGEAETANRLAASVHFEPRYHYADFDLEDLYGDAANEEVANAKLLKYMENFRRMWEWVASTDVTNPSRVVKPFGTVEAPVYKYYLTRDSEYNPAHKDQYYELKDGEFVKVEILFNDILTPSDAGRKDDEGNLLEATTIGNTQTFLTKLLDATSKTNKEDILGNYIFSYDTETEQWNMELDVEDGENILIASMTVEEMKNDWTITMPSHANEEWVFSIEYSTKPSNWSALYYQQFEKDSDEYRLSKFRAEFTEHFNLPHTIFYFIMTELLLLYDSRQKNMMIASWGPEKENGDYIWYPIFYDMDTQLGINNSGQVYWDYDVDATPKEDVSQSIFSGTGSVLWANLFTCFEDKIKQMYRQLRQNGLEEKYLKYYYDESQSDKWTEQMKNIDAFYKYIAPSSKALYGGYTTTKGEQDETSAFFYCLQGDRKLNRDLFFRNRLNYIDSYWLGGDYDSTYTSSVIARYNLNYRGETSDDDSEAFDGTPAFTITPYLSQYVSLAYDEIMTKPVRYKVGTSEPIQVEPPAAIQEGSDNGVVLTQQLIYFRGPAFLSDLGDLSKNYLNQFQSGPAIRLRNIQIGNDRPGYKNKLLEAKDLILESSENSANAKTLLRNLDLSNLEKYEGNLDIGGCIKIENLKLLGTKASSVTLPKGNILKKIYLPATVNALEFVTPLALTSVIEDPANAAYGNNQDGLYIEGLTDKLNEAVDENSTTAIIRYQMDDTKLGYHTYRILKRLFDIKREAQKGTLKNATVSKDLRIQAKNVEWTPYDKLETDTTYGATDKTFYYLNDKCEYEVYNPSGRNWREDLQNLGIYEANTTRGDNPVENLDLLEYLIDGYDNFASADYYFKALHDDAAGASIKTMPIISGRVHVNNDEDTPIDEIAIYKKFQADNHFPDLEITANVVNPCYRAKFIEYKDDGSLMTYGYLKSNLSTDVISYGENIGTAPIRLHYDFLGWTNNVDLMKSTNSVVTDADAGKYQILIDPNGNWISSNPGATFGDNITDTTETLTLCAVYKLHLYTITFMDGDGNQFYQYGASSKDPIVPPLAIPGKDDSGFENIETFYHFIGYSALSEGGASALVDFASGRVFPTQDITYYAQFEEANIYDYPLEPKHLLWMDAYGSTTEVEIALKSAYGFRGKICIPRTIEVNGVNKNVVSILGTTLADDGGVQQNDFNHNNRLTHIFVTGTKDDTAVLRALANNAFANNTKLQHMDIPSSLLSIGNSCFESNYWLKITDFKNVTTFGQKAMYQTGIGDFITNASSTFAPPDSVYISGNFLNNSQPGFGIQAFVDCGYRNIYIGWGGKYGIVSSTENIFSSSTAMVFRRYRRIKDYDNGTHLTVHICCTPDEDLKNEIYNMFYQRGGEDGTIFDVVDEYQIQEV